MNKGTVAIWLLILIAVFCISYILTDFVVRAVMANFTVEPRTGLTTLKVKEVPKGTLQTDQYTPLQGAVTPIGVEL